MFQQHGCIPRSYNQWSHQIGTFAPIPGIWNLAASEVEKNVECKGLGTPV